MEAGRGITRSFWLRVSHEAVVKPSVGEGWATSKLKLTHQAVGGKVSFLPCGHPCRAALDITAGFPQSE